MFNKAYRYLNQKLFYDIPLKLILHTKFRNFVFINPTKGKDNMLSFSGAHHKLFHSDALLFAFLSIQIIIYDPQKTFKLLKRSFKILI